MTSLTRFRSMLVAASLFAASAACTQKSETRREADRAAEAVKDQVEDLQEESRDLADTAKDKAEIADNGTADMVDRDVIGDRDDTRYDSVDDVSRDVARNTQSRQDQIADDVDDVADDAKEVGKNARELADASSEFRYRKMVRIQTLRAVHAVEASQPMLINAFAQSFPLVEKDRGEVNEKLVIFQMRLDEAGNAIQSLELVEAKDWEVRNDAASKALDRAEDAREEVWESLRDADQIGDRTSMR
ncbi:MAG: hypothetical protein H0T42_17275 [Deltaproteobacteria bacterium]|nr:hypothetical protein [Deltaproteobacteria bacterium]